HCDLCGHLLDCGLGRTRAVEAGHLGRVRRATIRADGRRRAGPTAAAKRGTRSISVATLTLPHKGEGSGVALCEAGAVDLAHRVERDGLDEMHGSRALVSLEPVASERDNVCRMEMGPGSDGCHDLIAP